MVTVRIVSSTTEEDVRRPRTSAHGLLRVVALAAVPPEFVAGPVACEAHGLGALPDLIEGMIAHAPAPVRGRWQRRTPLDRTIRFDAECQPSCGARKVMPAFDGSAEERLVRAEVADVVAWRELHAALGHAAMN